jgi:chromosomal replication initiator protein
MEKKDLWQAVLGELELSISKANFNTWLKNTAVKTLAEEEIIVLVPNIFAKEWLEKKYKKPILESVQRFFPKINRLSCSVTDNPLKETQESPSATHSSENTPGGLSLNKKTSSSNNPNSRLNANGAHDTLNNLNPRYNFDYFVIGSNNELAYAACQAVVDNPGKNYNPLFIYGGVGLGKTHLLQATGNQIIKDSPGAKIRYTSMERFANELLDAIQNQKAKEFKNRYIQLDVLILDDIQFLSGKEKTQEEFFHIFESLYQHGKQIILSSDRYPKSIPTLEDRLRSRFEGGMMADVNKPDLETRISIINNKLKEKDFYLDPEIVTYLAESIYHNVRELEGALNKIIVIYQFKNNNPTLTEVIELTKDVISVNRRKSLTPEKIIRSVAEFYNVKPEEISSRCRKKNVVKPRQIAIYLIRQEARLSFPEIGTLIGGRDHSTAIYACEKITKEIKKNNILQDQLKFIKEKFIEY